MGGEKRRHGAGLVGGDGVDVGEAAAGGEVHGVGVSGWIVDCGFWVWVCDFGARVHFGGADGGYEGAGVGPGWVEDVEIGAETAGWTVGTAC